MLLRKITEHVQAQNWTAIAIDFFIVVIGVFIGIQLGNWNESREERIAEIGYLERYHEDLSGTLDMFSVRLNLINRQLEEIPNTISAIEDDKSTWQVIRAYFIISDFTPPEIRTATYTDMVSSGRLEIIADQNLRSKIVEHYSRNGALPILDSEPPYRKMVRGIIPFALQDYLTSSACIEAFTLHQPCLPPAQWTQQSDNMPSDHNKSLIEIATTLKQDENLTRALNYNLSHHKIARQIIIDITQKARALRDEIEDALKKEGVRY